MKPSNCSFNNPAKSPQSFGRLYSPTRDSWSDTSQPTSPTTTGVVVAFVCMKFAGSSSWSTSPLSANGGNNIKHLLQHPGVVLVCRAHCNAQGDSPAINNDVVFAARTTSIYGIGASFLAPLFAWMTDESRDALSQSIFPAAWSSSKISRWSFFQTPAFCQSRRRRQQVIPLPQPNSSGKYSQGVPVFRMNNIPVRAFRSSTRGRPPLGFLVGRGRMGSSRVHSLSGNSFLAMPQRYAWGRKSTIGYVRHSKSCPANRQS